MDEVCGNAQGRIFGMRIKAQKIPQTEHKKRDLVAVFCYYFPQYTYFEAKKLPYKRIKALLLVAQQEQAREWYNLLRISIVVQSGKKSAVKDLFDEYKNIIQSS